MADYLSIYTYKQFLSSAKSLSEGTEAISLGKRSYKSKGLDLDAFHRHHRICVKRGLMKAIERHDSIDYILTPRGLAIYDQYQMRRKRNDSN